MKKSLIFAAVAAVALSACAKIETVKVASVDEAIGFGVYVPKAITKAGSDNVLNNDELQNTGFGVFAAYHPNGTYSTSSKMDFMWNQSVTYSSSSWIYSPVKYWPNQTGTDAFNENVDRLSFFAYAPYVNPSTAGTFDPAETTGIIGITANTATGDPKISYVCDPAHPVDLCWGVIDASKTWVSSYEGINTALTAGLPYKDLAKPKDTPTVKFLFKHALAKIVVDVKTVEDGAGTSNIGVADGTRIFVRSLSINGENIYNAGSLNLNNTTANVPLWEVTGTAGTAFNVDITTYEKLYIESKPTAWSADWTIADKPGVTSTAAPLFSGMAIPTTVNDGSATSATSASIASVTIVYDVITKDEQLDGGVSVIENNITKSISIEGFSALSAGNVYTLHLQLGMKTVDVEADVSEWASTYSTEVDLPANVDSE